MNQANNPTQQTDPQQGILAPTDRDRWLHNHSQDSSDWTDGDILTAMGAGMNGSVQTGSEASAQRTARVRLLPPSSWTIEP